MDEREQLLETLKTWKADRDERQPKTADDFRQFDPNAAEAMNEAGVDYAEAAAYARRHALMMLAASNGGAVRAQYEYATREFEARSRDRLQGQLMPPILKDAIKRMEGTIAHRKSLGYEDRTVNMYPGARMYPTAVNRKPADDAATVRAEQALGKLRALVMVPIDELGERITAILTELHQADLDAIWTAPPPAPEPAPQTAKATKPKAAKPLPISTPPDHAELVLD